LLASYEGALLIIVIKLGIKLSVKLVNSVLSVADPATENIPTEADTMKNTNQCVESDAVIDNDTDVDKVFVEVEEKEAVTEKVVKDEKALIDPDGVVDDLSLTLNSII